MLNKPEIIRAALVKESALKVTITTKFNQTVVIETSLANCDLKELKKLAEDFSNMAAVTGSVVLTCPPAIS